MKIQYVSGADRPLGVEDAIGPWIKRKTDVLCKQASWEPKDFQNPCTREISERKEDGDMPDLCINCTHYPFLGGPCVPGNRGGLTKRTLAGGCNKFKDASLAPKDSLLHDR